MDDKYVALNSVVGYERVANGYYFNTADGRLYSTKQGNGLTALMGSYVSGVRRYTLQLRAEKKNWYNETFTARQDAIKDAVGRMKTKDVAKASVSGGTVAASKGWVIGSVSGGNFSIAATPKIHTTEVSVNAEIERLAMTSPGKTYVKMKLESYVKAGGVSWS